MKVLKFFICLLVVSILCGCASTQTFSGGARHPEIEITQDGGVLFHNKFVAPDKLPDLLDDAGFRKDETINVLVPANSANSRSERIVMGVLYRAGYRRTVLIGKREAYSEVTKQGSKRSTVPPRNTQGQKRTIRYK